MTANKKITSDCPLPQKPTICQIMTHSVNPKDALRLFIGTGDSIQFWSRSRSSNRMKAYCILNSMNSLKQVIDPVIIVFFVLSV